MKNNSLGNFINNRGTINRISIAGLFPVRQSRPLNSKDKDRIIVEKYSTFRVPLFPHFHRGKYKSGVRQARRRGYCQFSRSKNRAEVEISTTRSLCRSFRFEIVLVEYDSMEWRNMLDGCVSRVYKYVK